MPAEAGKLVRMEPASRPRVFNGESFQTVVGTSIVHDVTEVVEVTFANHAVVGRLRL